MKINQDKVARCEKETCQTFWKLNYLAVFMAIGVFLGLTLGFSLRLVKLKWTEREIMYFSSKMTIIPLIVSTLIASVASLDLQVSGKIGFMALFYYLLTTLLAVSLGILLVITIQPGIRTERGTQVTYKDRKINDTVRKQTLPIDSFLDLARNLIPENMVQACIKTQRTMLVKPKEDDKDLSDWQWIHEYHQGTNNLGLIFLSLVLAASIIITEQNGLPLLNFFTSLAFVMMIIMNWIIHLAPIGIIFLVAAEIVKAENVADIFVLLGWYLLVVMAGLMMHGIVLLPFIFSLKKGETNEPANEVSSGVTTCHNPFRFIWNMSPALMTAFTTASSQASLSVSIKCIEENNKIDPRIARFVLPLGSTINMDGTALYEAVACLFLAQVHGLDLTASDIVSVSLTATAASIGAAGIPSAGLITLIMVVDNIGLKPKDISLILILDFLLDRFRTTVNVLGDSLCAGIVHYNSQHELQALDRKPVRKMTIVKHVAVQAPTNSDESDDSFSIEETLDGSPVVSRVPKVRFVEKDPIVLNRDRERSESMEERVAVNRPHWEKSKASRIRWSKKKKSSRATKDN